MIRQPRRGLSNIRTYRANIGAASESTSLHAVYLKMAMLEMERERRGKELITASARAAQTTKRLGQIGDEITALRKLVEVAEHGALQVGADPDPAWLPEAAPPALPGRSRVFRF